MITVNRKSLVKALRAVDKLPVQHMPVPPFRLTGSIGALTVGTTDGTTTLKISIPCDCNTEWTAAPDLRALIKLVAAANGDTVDITPAEPRGLIVDGVTVDGQYPDDLPVIKPGPAAPNTSPLGHALAGVGYATSADPRQLNLDALHVHGGRVWATDGHRLACSVPIPELPEKDRRIPHVVGMLLQSIPPATSWGWNDNRLTLRGENWVIVTRMEPADLPGYDRVWPTEPFEPTAQAPRKSLIAAVKQIRALVRPYVWLFCDGDGITVAADPAREQSVRVQDSAATATAAIPVNSAYILDMLESADAPVFCFQTVPAFENARGIWTPDALVYPVRGDGGMEIARRTLAPITLKSLPEIQPPPPKRRKTKTKKAKPAPAPQADKIPEACEWAAKVHRAMAKRGNRRCGPLARRWFGIAQRGTGRGTVFYLTAAYKLASRR